MKTTTFPLLALMKSGQQFVLADLYTITLQNGQVLHWTDYDTDLTTGTNQLTYSEDFKASGWDKISVGTGTPPSVTKNAGLGPDGITPCCAITFDLNGGSTTTDSSTIRNAYPLGVIGQPLQQSIYLRTYDGSTQKMVFDFSGVYPNCTLDGYTDPSGIITVTGEWSLYRAGFFSAASTNMNFALRLRGGMGVSDRVTVFAVGAQKVIGSLAPQEYVKTSGTTVSGGTFSASGPVVKRGNTRTIIGLEVDTLDLEIFPEPTHTVNGLSMLAAAVAGSFDGAQFKLERGYIGNNGVLVGRVHMFSGIFADVDVARARIGIRVNSDLASLQIQLPRSLYQSSCLHTLYSADCGASAAAFEVAGTVADGSTESKILSGLAQATGYFDSGYCVFTSGDLAGIRRTVKGYSPGQFSLYNPLPATPAVGDTFSVYPGCDKTRTTCTSKFSNLSNFRGFPFIPVPETAL